jgi:hypothetical protein
LKGRRVRRAFGGVLASLILATCSAAEPARVPIPNAAATVVLPAGWDVNAHVWTTAPMLTLQRVRTGTGPWPAYPEANVVELKPPSTVKSLRSAVAWHARRLKTPAPLAVRYVRDSGVELATWTRSSTMIVDFAGGRGANIAMRSHNAVVGVDGHYFQCLLRRDGNDTAPAADDDRLVVRLCASLRLDRIETRL